MPSPTADMSLVYSASKSLLLPVFKILYLILNDLAVVYYKISSFVLL